MNSIPVFKARRPDLEVVMGVFEKSLSAGQYSNFGPVHEDFRSELASFFSVQVDNIALLANATLALQAAIETSSRSKEIWTLPSWSFLATGMAALGAGPEFRFGDVEEESGWLRMLDQDGPALAVAPFSADPRAALAHPDSHIVDAAASFDACRDIGLDLNGGVGIVISTHATKLLNSGEGGIFVSLDTDWVSRVRSWSTFGFLENSRDSVRRGTNAKMSEITAALGISSLRRWESDRVLWRQVNEQAIALSDELRWQVAGGLLEGSTSPYWVIKLDSESERDTLAGALARGGVESRRWWGGGMHKIQAFQNIELREPLTQTERWADTYLGLPMHTFLSPKDFELIRSLASKAHI